MTNLTLIVLFVCIVLVWSRALADLWQTHFTHSSNKLLAFLLIILLPIIGSALYFRIKSYIGGYTEKY